MDDSMEVSAFENDASSDFEPPAKVAVRIAPSTPSSTMLTRPQKAKAPAKATKAPAVRKAAAPKPKAAPKATAAKTAASKPAAAKPRKRAKPDSDDENSDGEDLASMNDDSLLSNTPLSAKKQKKAPPPKKVPGPALMEVENESFAMDGASDPKPAKPKPKPQKMGTATEQYQKLSQKEHILVRPDTYIGSVESTTDQMWVFNSETENMEFRKVSFVPGLYKIFDEILVNAADNKQRDKNMNELRVWVDREKGVIAVKNNGRGIPIEIHEKEGIYIPEMIFGHLLTSSNYDDTEAKTTGGRNGYGAKLTNIFSTRFDLETVDSKTKQKYKQTWRDNMSIMDPAKVTPIKGVDDYTKITFMPDFEKFGMEKMDDDFEALVKRRVYDMAGTSGVKVYLNDSRIKISKFKQYMEMYTKAIKMENLVNDGTAPEQVILTDNPHERWEIGFAVSDGSFQQVSFVNSIATTSGGSHVNFIADQICEKLEEIVNKKNKGGVKLKKAQIRNHIFLFVNCLIENPAFTSQTKEQLTTKPSGFGSKPHVSEKFLKDIAKTEAVTNILHFAQQKADKVLSKSDGNRRQRMNNSKLTDANKAGTKDGHLCTLILTEGDSASLLALAGRAVVSPDHFGVFPLRGKMLNVRDASIDQISKNAEIQNIKKFMGLQHKKDYTDVKSLRYGHLMIMTDQDHDGSHIKGLLINFLQVQFPSLLKLEGFLLEFITPIVKVWKGDPKNPKMKRDFFTMPEYEAWRQEPGHSKGWEHKYYKGLGTSDTRDAEIYFADLDKHLKRFHRMQQDEPDMIDLAFSKKKADARKQWLGDLVPGTYLDMSLKDDITYGDFINKELILFSMADNMRSIPSVIDGFKPSQRKVLYTCFRRNLKKDVKVVELAGSVSGLTAYAYGDTSLQQTIVGLAQNFVGSNNINCLEPSGNFGSRLQGGQDAASARYIYTRLSPFARRIFHQTDEALLTYNTDDGKTIEPETYMPILPMLLINGADGIGTGWSTSIPNYKPEDVIDNLKRRMDGEGIECMQAMTPWFRDWTGTTEQTRDDQFKFTGTMSLTGNDNEVEITELPVRVWTQDFKDKLEEVIRAEKSPSFIKDYTEYNTPEKVHFVIKLEEKRMEENLQKLYELFKLSKTMATSNLVAFDTQGRIHKYATPLHILEEFYGVRLQFYQKRKKHMLDVMQRELDRLSNQARFVKMIIDGKLVVSKKKKSVLVAELAKLGFTRFPKIVDAKKEGEFEAVIEEADAADEDEDTATTAGASDFDYLLGMAIWSLTQERVEKLLKQIGEKEVEIDLLTAKSPKDLWRADLDGLLIEWNIQLEEEAKREKKIKAKGRRASYKTGVPAKGGRKRKAGSDDEDEEFGARLTKKAVPKGRGLASLMALTAQASVNGIEQKSVVKPAEQMTLEGAFARSGAAAKPRAAAAAAARPKVQEISDEEEDMFAAVAREAAKPVVARKKTILSDDDDDVVAAVTKEVAKPKAAPRKKTVISDDDDEAEEQYDDALTGLEQELAEHNAPVAAPARAGRAAAQKPVKYALDSEDEEMADAPVAKAVVKPAAAPARAGSAAPSARGGSAAPSARAGSAVPSVRGGRAAAQKPKTYAVQEEDEEDENPSDDMLEDVSAMVKGIGGGTAANAASSRLFHTTTNVVRPSSSHVQRSRTVSSKTLTADSDVSDDETNWDALAQNSPQKATHHTVMSEDDEDFMTEKLAPKAAAAKAKPAPKAVAALKPKKAPAPAPVPAIKTLSPAAKAYAKKQAAVVQAKAGAKPAAAKKSRKFMDSDEDEDDVEALANDLLSDEGDDEGGAPVARAAAARPARRAAVAKKYVAVEESEEEEEEGSAEFEESFTE